MLSQLEVILKTGNLTTLMDQRSHAWIIGSCQFADRCKGFLNPPQLSQFIDDCELHSLMLRAYCACTLKEIQRFFALALSTGKVT